MNPLEATQDELNAQYQRATYRVDLPAGSRTIPLGEPPERWLVALLHDQPHWAFLTAWNPRSVLLALHQNQLRQAELEQSLAQAGFDFWPGWGLSAEGDDWAERSVLVIGITPSHAHALSQRWEQNAYVGPDTSGDAAVLWSRARP